MALIREGFPMLWVTALTSQLLCKMQSYFERATAVSNFSAEPGAMESSQNMFWIKLFRQIFKETFSASQSNLDAWLERICATQPFHLIIEK